MKKGALIIGDFLGMILEFIPVIIVSIFILFVAFAFLNEKIDTHDIEVFMLSRDLLYSDSCLAFSDDYRVFPMHVDTKKLDDERLGSCFSKSSMGFRITLLDSQGREVKSAKSLTLKQEGYLTKGASVNYPVCKAVPEYKCSKRKELIVYHTENKIQSGFLVIEVVNRVS
ncbi:MAG TPA: hypothetical protein VJG30_04405 [Candidatus Nanoarchaeia archaeon]|nr:hypothetical protein [Candidatus Nanoarchaeia archaeon]